MPTPPVTGRSSGKRKVLIEFSTDEDEGGGGGATRKGGGGGEGLKRIKPEPVDDVGINAEFRGAWGSASGVIPQRPKQPLSPPPLAAARRSRRPQPEIIDISSDDDVEYRGSQARSKPHGERRVKEKPPSSSGRSKVRRDPAPGSSTAERKRKRKSPGGSGTRRQISHEAGSSRKRNNGKNRKESRGSESRGKAGRGGSTTNGKKSSGPPPVDAFRATVASRTPSRVPQRRMQDASPSIRWVSDDEDEVEKEQQGRVQQALHSAREVSYVSLDSEEQEEEEKQEETEEEEQEEAMDLKDVNVEGDNGVASEGEQEEHVVGENREDGNGVSHGEEEQTTACAPDVVGEQHEREERGGEEVMDLNCERSDKGVAHEGEQVAGENREDGNGDCHGEEDQAAGGARPDVVGDQQEREGHSELVEVEDYSEEDSHTHSMYEGDEEEEDSETSDEEEAEGAGEPQSREPGITIAAGTARSGGDDTRTGKRMFEGMCILDKLDNTAGEAIGRRTRSKRKCSDSKLLKRGFFSKPVKIDISESSTSESEEKIQPPKRTCQVPLSSSEDEGEARRTPRRKQWRWKKTASTSSDESASAVKTRRYGRLEKGPSDGQAAKAKEGGTKAKEGGKAYDGSNPNRLKYSGHDPMNNAQDDPAFQKQSNLASRIKQHQSSRAKAEYEELLKSIFDEWDNYTKASVPADEQGSNTLPLIFSFENQDDEDKSDSHVFQEELWMDFDFALESIKRLEEDGQKVPPGELTSCKNGKHEFIIDEQIGVRCKHCNVVELEIRYVLPSMGKFAAGRDSTKIPELNMFKEMLTLFENNDLLVSNAYEGVGSFARKDGSVWDLIPGIKEDMFQHQQDAFEFVWRKLAGSTEIEELMKRTANSDIGGGCVISHAPGTGKTRLAITFVQSYLEVFPQCCPVIIAPRAMLATWEKEFKKWRVKLPFHVLNSTEINCSDDKTIQAKIEKDGSFARRVLENKIDQNYRRLVKLTSWVNGTSIIGVSYSLFRKLANDNGMDGDNVRKLLLEKPNLLVLDEGHTPRNKKSLIWKVLAQVRTEKRIILSGTLFQNNFEELYNTLYLVRPKDAMLLEKDGGKDWISLRLSNITEGDIDKVRAKLEPVVHYHKGTFLEKSLPGLMETVVILNPLPRQKEIIASMEKNAAMGHLDAEYKISLALVHPSLITCAKLSQKEASLVDHTSLESLRSEPCEGVKTRFVVEVLHQCQVLNERVLVFSQYLEPLSLIMGQLKKRFNWTEEKEILLMSGNVRVKQREAMMAAFNNMKSEAKVMLASTKACCEGITLVGASRVVLLDVVWNPSVGRQAIGRAYRIGQKKIVYTYNLIADGTTEMEKYNRQAKKEHMSKVLFSNEEQPEGDDISTESTFNDRVLEAMIAREDLKNLFVDIRIENQTRWMDQGCRGDGAEKSKPNNMKGE